MRQVLIKKGQVNVEDVPAPLLDERNILVEVAYSLISLGTEMAGIRTSGESLIQRAMKHPENIKKVLKMIRVGGISKTFSVIRGRLDEREAIGYSCSGIVLKVGDSITDIKPGDLVACAGAGRANHAEVVLVPRNLVVKVPEGCALSDAASVTLGAIAMQGVRRADPRLGENVAIIGLGLLGQITLQLLKLAGCRVVGFDIDDRRVELGKKLGLDLGANSSNFDPVVEACNFTAGMGVDATIITAASESTEIIQQAMNMTRKKGRVVVVGAVGLNLQRSPFYEKEIDFLISCSYGPGRYDPNYEDTGVDYPYPYVRWTENRNMEEYLRLISEGKFDFKSMVDRVYELEEAPRAYEELKQLEGRPLGVLFRYMVQSEVSTQPSEKLETKVNLPRVAYPESYLSRVIKVAVIGAGSFAKSVHLPNLQKSSSRYHISAIVARSGHHAYNIAKQFKADFASTDYQRVLEDPKIDMVLIATRHNLHGRMVLEALKAGKHVFVEKPLCLNGAELHQIVELYNEINQTNQNNQTLMVGFNRRFSPVARRAKEILSDRQNPLIINYRMNAGYIPLDHWVHTEEGGGRNIGEACHIYDLFNFFTESEVESISALSIAPKTKQYQRNDNFLAAISYKDGSLCNLIYTALGSKDYPKEEMEIYAEAQVLRMSDYQRLEVFGTRQGGVKTKAQDKGHLQELEAFSEALKTGEETIPFWQLVQATEISFEVEKLITHG